MKQQIQNSLCDVIQELFQTSIDDISLDTPPKKNMGDYAFGVFLLAKALKRSPTDIVAELKNYFDTHDTSYIDHVDAAGPYLNIFVKKDALTRGFFEWKSSASELSHIGSGKTIVIDYIGANVGKPLHIGHLCTPLQGQAMINLYRTLGYTVISDSHIGDWGIIFGKLICAYKKWGDESRLAENAVDYLLELYVKITAEAEQNPSLEDDIRAEFQMLAAGDSISKQLWSEFTKHSIKAMNIQLARLGVHPDYNIGESFYEGIGLDKMEDYPDLEYDMKSIVTELIDKNIATSNDDHSVGVIFRDETKIPSCILQKRDGTHGYLASDLACVKYRIQNWNPEKVIYFVDVRQQLHLKQVFEVSSQAGWLGDTELIHASNGFISLKDGAMSTRKGRIIKLDLLLDEAESRAQKIIAEKRSDIAGADLCELSKIIGTGAIIYGYLKKTRESDIVFDWDEFMSFEGNSGPYIQYSYVRAKSLLAKAGYQGHAQNYDVTSTYFQQAEEIDIIKLLMNYETVLKEVSDKNMPHILCSYLYDLSRAFSALYNSVNILHETDLAQKQIRLELIATFTDTLSAAARLLGIQMPEKM